MNQRNNASPGSLPADLLVERVEVRLLRLPVVESLDAAHGRTTDAHRDLAVVAVHGPDGLTGWGECAALTTAGYWHETASSSYTFLAATSADLAGRSALDLAGSTIAGVDSTLRPMAAAAVEMAALDLLLKADGRSLGEWLGSARPTVPAGAAVGLGPAADVAERVVGLTTEGYRRVKVKIEPATANLVTAAVVERATIRAVDGEGEFNGFELHIDANGSYPSGPDGHGIDAAAVDALVELAHLGVRVIEQPFPVGDEESCRALRNALSDVDLRTLVMVDESADSPAAIDAAAASGAVDGVVVKPARLGGLQAARRAITTLADADAEASVGGMVESALGRRSLAAVAALDGVTITGDLSPARRWLGNDPWPDLETSTVDGALHVHVPTTPGVAPAPNPDVLDRHTVERTSAEG